MRRSRQRVARLRVRSSLMATLDGFHFRDPDGHEIAVIQEDFDAAT
jgi:hypothetical protein